MFTFVVYIHIQYNSTFFFVIGSSLMNLYQYIVVSILCNAFIYISKQSLHFAIEAIQKVLLFVANNLDRPLSVGVVKVQRLFKVRIQRIGL